jgi:hypothetical protein
MTLATAGEALRHSLVATGLTPSLSEERLVASPHWKMPCGILLNGLPDNSSKPLFF